MKTAVLLSGGVDSSVALAELHRAGCHDLTAFYLKIWLEDELHFLGDCPWEDDLRYVRAVCEQFDVPLEVIPLQREYHARVVAFALDELRAGRTPSPDILCNQHIKFGEFFRCLDADFEFVASGHYAQIERQGDRCRLKRAPDPVKDQTYFLVRLNQQQLRRACFPIGHLHKHEVRARAQQLALPNRHRPDSQGICFLGKIAYRDFVRFHLGERPGPIVELATGRQLGEHQGFWFYTIGQRQGLGLSGGPWYVVRRDTETNTVFVAHGNQRHDWARDALVVADCRWIDQPPARPDLQAKLRHGPQLIECRVHHLGADRWEVRLAEPDPGIAPGQWAILYDGDYCLGGGIIE